MWLGIGFLGGRSTFKRPATVLPKALQGLSKGLNAG